MWKEVTSAQPPNRYRRCFHSRPDIVPVTPHTPTSARLEGRRHYAALADDVHGAQHEQPARLVRVAVWRIRFGFGVGRVEDSGQLRHGARRAHSGGGGGGEDDPARRVEAGGGAVQLVPEAQG